MQRVATKLSVAVFAGALITALVVAIPASTATADVAQTPVATGCPAGFPATNIQALETAQGHPYFFAEQLDQAGNNDGVICARQISDGLSKVLCGANCPYVLFYFYENDNPAAVHAQAGS